MIGRLRQLSEPRLRQQAGIEKSQTPVERDILVQWVRTVILRLDILSGKILVGWLVGFRFNGPLRQYFSLYRAVSQREGERGKKG